MGGALFFGWMFTCCCWTPMASAVQPDDEDEEGNQVVPVEIPVAVQDGTTALPSSAASWSRVPYAKAATPVAVVTATYTPSTPVYVPTALVYTPTAVAPTP